MSLCNRIIWLDIAKGITIILMVLGHSSIPDGLSRFIYTFHMPLFFISSGWVTNFSKYNIVDFISHKARTLLLPFIVYSAVVLILINYLGKSPFVLWIKTGWGGYALWFIPVLYFALVISQFIYKLENRGIRLTILFIVLVGAAVLSYNKIVLPWNLASVPYAIVFIMIGAELNKLQNKIAITSPGALVALTLVTLLISMKWRLDMAWNNITPIIPITIGAISGTILVYMISVLVDQKLPICSRMFQSIGKETYLILALSQIVIIYLNEMFLLNGIVKYSLLVLILVVLKFIKDFINRILTIKLL